MTSDLGFWSLDRAGETLLTRLFNRGSLVRWSLDTDTPGPELPGSQVREPDARRAIGTRWALWRIGAEVELRDAVTGEVRATLNLHPAGDHASSVDLSPDERVAFVGTRSGAVLRVHLRRGEVEGGGAL